MGAGETDLESMLASIDVERRPGAFAFVTVVDPTPDMVDRCHATVDEVDETTLVLTVDDAERFGFTDVVPMAWLTLTVHSSLEAVGLTAAFSAALGERGIPCNVLAGYRHDHILVPLDRVDDATAAILGLRR